MSAVERWDARCLLALVKALTTDSTDAIAEWIGEHVTVDTSSWEDFAMILAGLASSWIEDTVKAQLNGGPVMYAAGEVDGYHVDELAVRMVVMMLNEDRPGVHGVLAAVRAADDWQQFCGALAGIARRAMVGAPVVEVL